jgi:hypothetical protein
MLFVGCGMVLMFSVVFMFFAFRFEGTGLLSSPHRGEQSCSERNAPSLLATLAGGGATAMQCHDLFRGAKLPRSNQKRDQQASEHDINQYRKDGQSSHEHGGTFKKWMVADVIPQTAWQSSFFASSSVSSCAGFSAYNKIFSCAMTLQTIRSTVVS